MAERFVYALVAHRGVVLAEGANRLLQGDFARIAYVRERGHVPCLSERPSECAEMSSDGLRPLLNGTAVCLACFTCVHT